MTWTTFHHRGEVLRTVSDTLDARSDGVLPMDLPGVPETFGDELSLLAALQLRWHTRLSGRLERALAEGPVDTDAAAIASWHTTYDELPGTRRALDHYGERPIDTQMSTALSIAADKERLLLAAAAGRTGTTTDATLAAGRVLEERARATYRPRPWSSRPV